MTEERDYEHDAQQEGWRPKEEWQGNPEQWVDAKTFVERGEKIAGILKKKVDSLEQRLSAAEVANRKFGEYHKKTIQKERETAEHQVEKMKEKLAEAIEQGDGQAFNMLNDRIHTMQNNMPEPDFETTYDDVTEKWLSENEWYRTDPVLATFADGAADRIRSQGYAGQAYFNELTRMVKETFPEKFGNPNRNRASSVGEGSPDIDIEVKPKTYEALPKEAKQACDNFVAQGFMTKEDYVNEYDWDEVE